MQMVIEMPDELKGGGEAVKAMIRQVEANWRSTRGGRAVDYAAIERQVAAGVAAIERAGHQAVRQGLDIDKPRVVSEGLGYRRVGRYEADYYTMAGPVRIMRTLYRECGQRNAKTVNAVSLRSGAVGEGWLPRLPRRWRINSSRAPHGRRRAQPRCWVAYPMRGRVLRVSGRRWDGSTRPCGST